MKNQALNELLDLKKKGHVKNRLFWFWGFIIFSYSLISLAITYLEKDGNHKATLQEVQKVDSTLNAKIEVLGDSLRQNTTRIKQLDSNVTQGREQAIDKIMGKLDKIEKRLPAENPKKKK